MTIRVQPDPHQIVKFKVHPQPEIECRFDDKDWTIEATLMQFTDKSSPVAPEAYYEGHSLDADGNAASCSVANSASDSSSTSTSSPDGRHPRPYVFPLDHRAIAARPMRSMEGFRQAAKQQMAAATTSSSSSSSGAAMVATVPGQESVGSIHAEIDYRHVPAICRLKLNLALIKKIRQTAAGNPATITTTTTTTTTNNDDSPGGSVEDNHAPTPPSSSSSRSAIDKHHADEYCLRIRASSPKFPHQKFDIFSAPFKLVSTKALMPDKFQKRRPRSYTVTSKKASSSNGDSASSSSSPQMAEESNTHHYHDTDTFNVSISTSTSSSSSMSSGSSNLKRPLIAASPAAVPIVYREYTIRVRETGSEYGPFEFEAGCKCGQLRDYLMHHRILPDDVFQFWHTDTNDAIKRAREGFNAVDTACVVVGADLRQVIEVTTSNEVLWDKYGDDETATVDADVIIERIIAQYHTHSPIRMMKQQNGRMTLAVEAAMMMPNDFNSNINNHVFFACDEPSPAVLNHPLTLSAMQLDNLLSNDDDDNHNNTSSSSNNNNNNPFVSDDGESSSSSSGDSLSSISSSTATAVATSTSAATTEYCDGTLFARESAKDFFCSLRNMHRTSARSSNPTTSLDLSQPCAVTRRDYATFKKFFGKESRALIKVVELYSSLFFHRFLSGDGARERLLMRGKGSYLVRFSHSRMADGYFSLDVTKANQNQRLVVESYLIKFNSETEKFLFDGKHFSTMEEFVRHPHYFKRVLFHPVTFTPGAQGLNYQEDEFLQLSLSNKN